ncbi:hypothetical protein ES703_12748 [subsurface metagenome]
MNDLARILKHRRVMKELTLYKLGAKSAVSASHLGRIERRERFPSARILRKLAKPLGFSEPELFTLASYLTPKPSSAIGSGAQLSRLDPYVAEVLSQESVEMQRAVFGILNILTNLAKTFAKE